ncbi:MAG: IclR family transcriptional regulator [Amylibacter sp.]|jgi:IclR family transcriptional regulator, KDG regulon repressor|nr:IclR family transcriptional regulator [Amylibacter sp.]
MNKPVVNDGTVGKALEVLDLVASLGRPVRFTELLSLAKFPKASLYRFLQTLTNQGMLSYDPKTQSYAPGLRLVRLAHSAWRQSSLAPVARPYLDALAEKTGEAVHLAQLDHGHVLFVDKRKGTDNFDTLAQAGKVAPSYCTGVGKAILAFMSEPARNLALQQQAFLKYTPATHDNTDALAKELNEVRADGVAYDREEHEVGIISIAAPILTDGETVIGALSIATSTSRHTLDALDVFRPALLETATQIANAASTWQFPTQN